MEDMIILRNVLQDYIIEQSEADQQILNLFIQDEYKEYKISLITGYPIPKINRVIMKLRVYLKSLNYN